METTRAKTVNRPSIVAKPAATVSRATARGTVQPSSMKVSSPGDPAEKEADRTAKKIMRMAIPNGSIAYVKTPEGSVFRQIRPEEKDKKIQPKFRSPYIDRFPAEKIHRKTEGQPNIAANVSADIANSMTTGAPLPLSVRRFMEPRFSANFSDVKVHTGDKSAKLNRQLNARAFTVGNQIFFGKNQFQPEQAEGKELIAHELTHTIQQGAAIQRSEDVTVTQQAPVQVQRLGLSDALDYFADKANLIPGFRMFTIILGVNPINMSSVDRSAANILRALVEFLPGGGLIVQALDNHGVFEKVGKWVEQQIKTLGLVGSSIKRAITAFLDSLSWKDIFDLGGVWNRAKSIFTEPIDRIISFAKGLVTGILKFIKEAIVRPLAKLAEGTAGYDLLKVVLGEDPVTGDPVPFNPDLLIGGFMKLIGQEEVWNNLKKANGVARATAWFKGAMASIVSFVRQIPGLFIAALQALEITDIILVPRAFGKLVKVFGGFVGQFTRWAGNAVWNLLEIIFDVVSPGAFAHVKRAGAALRSILKNPLPFVGNLVKAAKKGFLNFADNIGTHLKAGLLDWLTGAMPGVYIPKSFSLVEIAKFVFSVLRFTWAVVRGKLVKVVGEPAVKAMETGFDIVVTLVTQGPAAAWVKIKEQLGNLKDMVIGGITDFVVDMVVKKAIPKLVAMFIPGAGFISAILSIYDTIMVFVQKLSKIAAVVSGFVASIVSIAAGVIGAAAKRIESTLAGLLSLAISFLAGFAGLGNVASKLNGILEKVRAPIDKAIDWLINFIVTTAKKLFAKFFGKKDQKDGADKPLDLLTLLVPFQDKKGKPHKLFFSGQGASARLKVASNEMFTDEFAQRVEKVLAEDPLARSLGTGPLGNCRKEKNNIDSLQKKIEKVKATEKLPVTKFLEADLKDAMRSMSVSLSVLIDLLPENQPDDFPVKPGQFVTIPYKNSERKGEILVVSNERVRYKVDAVSAILQMKTAEFRSGWTSGKIREYVEGSLREKYLGATPGKASATGRKVLARYQNANPSQIRTTGSGVVEVEWKPAKWHPLTDCDMSHEPIDAVDYWNNTGRHQGSKSPAVRAWMLDSNNYSLEPASINRSRGSRNNSKYLPPTV